SYPFFNDFVVAARSLLNWRRERHAPGLLFRNVREPPVNFEPLTDLRTRILRRLLDYLRLEVARLVAIHRLSLPCVRNRSGKNNSPSAGLGHGLACGKRGRLGRVLVLRIRDHVIGLRLLVQGKRALEVALPQRDRAPVRSLVDSALTSPLDGCFRTRDEVPADGDALLYMEILGL